MSDLTAVTISGDSNDPEKFEANVIRAKQLGCDTIDINGIDGPTTEQRTSEDDAWELWTVPSAGLFKIIETDLISGYFKPETYARNQKALRWKSEILLKHGLSASIRILEPQWMPLSWYADKPQIKGCRCDHPSVSRSAHYTLNLDNETVLEHYRQLARGLVELAPAVGRLLVWTNDSGAGINWCEGLYPGPNGPAATKDRDMGERIQTWFQAIRDGSKAGGREVVVDFMPYHFTPDETRSVAVALRTPSRLQCPCDAGLQNLPFTGEHLDRCRDACRDTDVPIIAAGAGGMPYAPMIAPPLVYLAGEMLMAIHSQDVHLLDSAPNTVGPLPDSKTPQQMVVQRCMEKCPANLVELHDVVASVAEELVGKEHAPALQSAWKDVDYALRSKVVNGENGYRFSISIYCQRWLTRPFVPVPDALNEEERGYWSEFLLGSRDVELAFKTMVSYENETFVKLDQFVFYYDGLEAAMRYFERAVNVLDGELAKAKEGDDTWTWLKDQRDRIDMFGCLFRCQLHATGVQWILDRFAGKPNADKWARPREKRRLYDMIDGEIENCRHIIELMKGAIAPLISVGKESTFSFPENLTEVLQKKIEVMRDHRRRVEEVFPDVDESGFQAVNYSEKGGIIAADETADQLEHPENLIAQ